MARRFRDANRQQGFLMPPTIEEWLPEGHLARYIVEIVDQLDLSAIYGKYGGSGGERAYEPKVLLGLLFYSYATGLFSSRKIERATYDSVAFRYISANTHPDHDTIATFRRRFLRELEALFVQILLIAQETGVLKVGNISLDGTKIKANASKHKALSYAYATKLQQQLEEEVEALMGMANTADESDFPDELSIPDEIARRQDRLEVIKAAKATIEARAKERYKEEKTEYDRKMQDRRAKEEQSGKKPRGKAPKAPCEEPSAKDQVNLTDKESRIMPIHGGGFDQAYNAQASVEHESRLIVHQHVTQSTNDKQQIAPTLQWFLSHPKLKPEAMNSDHGYYSQTNINACVAAHITPYISLGREQHNQPLEERLKTSDKTPPEHSTPIEAMRHRLQTQEGKALYALRKSTIETTFGIIKAIMGFRQFLLRGFEKVQGEWSLVCIAYNLKRMHTLRG